MKKAGKLKLGTTNMIKIDFDLYVYQIIAQSGLTRSKIKENKLDIGAFRNGLKELCSLCLSQNLSVHTYPIGSGQAGGRWFITKQILIEELVNRGVKTKVYFLSKDKSKRRNSDQEQMHIF